MILFYYPVHFNRDSNVHVNEFIRPFIQVLDSENKPYKVVEEPNWKHASGSSKLAGNFYFWFILVLLLRKVIPLFFFSHFERREQWIGRLVRYFSFGAFSADVIFTLSNSMGGFWRGYNPNARIIDYQHGIINGSQPGFFNGKVPTDDIFLNNKEVAVWGEGFKHAFHQGEYYLEKVHVLGYYKSFSDQKIQESNKILFSLQFLPEFGPDLNAEMLLKLETVLSDLQALSLENRPQVILKNHPRHQNAVDLVPIVKKYDFVELMPDNNAFTAHDYLLHVTFFSTVAFEMAIAGIPSYFLNTPNLQQGLDVYFKEYNYPLSQEANLVKIWEDYSCNKELWLHHSEEVKDWSGRFFRPFNKPLFLELISISSGVKEDTTV